MSAGEVLTGAAKGGSKRAILETAEAFAVTFFGTACVEVKLSGAQLVDVEEVTDRLGNTVRETASFTARFKAQVHHRVEAPAYGPGRCQGCGKDSWPHNPLPRAFWGDDD